jgi:type IV pilus assembly protein PilB
LLIPIKIIDAESIMVAMNDPLNVFALDDVEITTRMKPVPVLAKSQDIKEAINTYYGATKAVSLAAEFQKEIEEKKKKNSSQFDDEQSELDVANSPAVKLVNTIIDQAIIRGASDIHIEPFSGYVRVRLRIDGQLQQMLRTDISTLNGLVTRIKILGKMDIAERRIPQDGRIAVTFERTQLDLRVSVLPTVYGEKVVIRLIYHTGTVINKERLGFFQEDLDKFNKLLMNTNGVILVTGPTGSGKSTTLATAMKELNKDNVNIITVEDPVENVIEGVNQVHVNVKAGLTFPEALRSILRQDPDIVMIGEMRDTETASIAIRAAITGHLVLSTLHTNDSVSSISRLIDMGVESYMVASAVRGIIAQRLVREVCHSCCQEVTISPEDALILKVSENTKIKKAVGCKLCNNTGYKGRFAVHEIFMLTATVREAIAKGIKEEELKKLALEAGMRSLWDNTIRNVLNGRTTLDELYRVAYVQE